MTARRSSSLFRDLPLWVRLGGAALAAALAFSVTISAALPARGSTFLLLFPTVVAAAYLAGRDAGIAATATAALLVGVRILLNWGSLGDPWVQVTALVVFVLFGAGIAVLLSHLKQTLRELESANQELQLANDAARQAEQDTDLLLRELRHRVRNDVSNVIAILRLQAKRAGPDAAEPLLAAADRLQVLAKVHRRLTRQGHSPVVEIQGFLNDLCTELQSTLLPLKPVAIRTDVEPMELPSARAVSLGLIVNELVTNASKYAFPDDRGGTICVELCRTGSELVLSVCDDGVGMPSDPADGPLGSGLGQRLVRSFSAQLGGSFECSQSAVGTDCKVRFPAESQGSSG